MYYSVGTAPVDEPTAISFTIPLTGSTTVSTAAVVTTCSASVDCTDSATPTCSRGVCVAMSYGGGSYTPDGAYGSPWHVMLVVCVLAFVSGFVSLVLLRFLLKPFVWSCIVLIFLLILAGGLAAWVRATQCADDCFTDSASPSSSTVDSDCLGGYAVEGESARDALKYCAYVCIGLSVVYLFRVTKTVPVQNTNTAATGRALVGQLLSTMPITRI